jgi:hypothetical protein
MATATKKTTTKTPTGSRAKKTQSVLDAVKLLSPETIISEVGALQVSLQSTLANVSAAITDKIEKMKQVDEAISLKEERIVELYDIDQEALTLEDVKNRRSEEEAEWTRSREERRKVWSEEQAERNRIWQREQEEHAYLTTTEQQRKKEEFEAEVIRLKRDETLRSERLQKDWADREAELLERENELIELRDKVSKVDDTMKAEVAKAEAVLGNKLKRDYDYQIQLLDKDIQAERSLNNAKVESLNATISALSDQLEEAHRQLVAARQDAKEVTERALESASGRQVSAALQSYNQGNSSKK